MTAKLDSYLSQQENKVNKIQALEVSWQMAKNLGKELSKQNKRKVSKSEIRKLFIGAFGDVTGESKLKNRKRYLLLPEEADKTVPKFRNNQISRSGSDFLALAKVLGSSRSDALHILIKDTPYEPRGFSSSNTDGPDHEFIDNICRQISKKYNLMEYFWTLKNNTIGAEYMEETSQDYSETEGFRRLNLGEHNFSELYDSARVQFRTNSETFLTNREIQSPQTGRHLTHSLSPTVFLGTLFTPKPLLMATVSDDIAKKWGKLTKQRKSFQFEQEFKTLFGDIPFFDEDGVDLNPQGDNYKKEARKWDKMIHENNFDDRSLTWVTGYSAVRLALSFLPDFKRENVHPVILRNSNILDAFGVYSHFSNSKLKQYSFNDTRTLYNSLITNDYILEPHEEQSYTNNYDYFGWVFEPMLISEGIGKTWLTIECDKSTNWLCPTNLTNFDDRHIFEPGFTFDENAASPYPSSTIFGMIHRHLLMHEPDKSIFGVLDQEADMLSSSLKQFTDEIYSNARMQQKVYTKYFT